MGIFLYPILQVPAIQKKSQYVVFVLDVTAVPTLEPLEKAFYSIELAAVAAGRGCQNLTRAYWGK